MPLNNESPENRPNRLRDFYQGSDSPSRESLPPHDRPSGEAEASNNFSEANWQLNSSFEKSELPSSGMSATQRCLDEFCDENFTLPPIEESLYASLQEASQKLAGPITRPMHEIEDPKAIEKLQKLLNLVARDIRDAGSREYYSEDVTFLPLELGVNEFSGQTNYILRFRLQHISPDLEAGDYLYLLGRIFPGGTREAIHTAVWDGESPNTISIDAHYPRETFLELRQDLERECSSGELWRTNFLTRLIQENNCSGPSSRNEVLDSYLAINPIYSLKVQEDFTRCFLLEDRSGSRVAYLGYSAPTMQANVTFLHYAE